MSLVGIIANPASGKDIRRLVSHATTVNNHEKVSIVRRTLLSLCASGVGHIVVMPDHFGIGKRALAGLRDRPEVLAAMTLIDMPFEGTAADSARAARRLRQAGAGCIVILGGDGTCRAVAKGCGDVPLLAISTGTNNVVPRFIEGTIAGLAAAHIALHPEIEPKQLCRRHKRLLVHVNGEETEQALVEVALVASGFVGTRAVWRPESLRQVFVTRAQPVNIGVSSLVGVVHPIGLDDPVGASVTIVPGGSATAQRTVIVPLAPGCIVPVGIGRITDLEPGVRYPVMGERPAVLVLDGERESVLGPSDRATVTLDLDGPWIVDVERTMLLAAREGAFAVGNTTGSP